MSDADIISTLVAVGAPLLIAAGLIVVYFRDIR